MFSLKRLGVVALLLVGTLAVTESAAMASPAVTGWTFSGWGSGGTANVKYSSTFSITNAAKECAIYGWQSTGGSPVALVEYAIVKKGTFTDTVYGLQRISGNFGQNDPTWYYHKFTGITASSGYTIRQTPYVTYPMNGGGNAYDGA